MTRNSDGRTAGADHPAEPLVQAGEAARAFLKRVLDVGRAPAEEMEQARHREIDQTLAKDPDWPRRERMWKRMCELLGVEGDPLLDARYLEHKHWDQLQRQRYGRLGAKLREINAVLDDPGEYEK